MKYQIDIEMCGSEATAAIAKRTAEILASDGYDCEFAECADNRYCDVAVPDSVFYAAVGRAASEVEAQTGERKINSKKITVEFVTMETPYGDKFVISDSFINHKGDLIMMWSTNKSGTATTAPEQLVANGYKIVSREFREVAYEQGADGSWSKINA